jgi:WhiB family transcriptional regulator, redox-sensing transcriptional regulator
MAPMQWPGTTAVLEGTAPQAFESAELSATSSGIDQQAASGSAAMVSVPTGLELPCRDDPELFFAESPDDVEFAKSLCRGCAARIACLAGALDRREPWGVWGGELFLRGAIVPRKRPRGRPRKTDVAA